VNTLKNNPPFLEKDFLIFLVSSAEHSCSKQWHKIKDHQFNIMDARFTDEFPMLIYSVNPNTIARDTLYWFELSTARGFTEKGESDYYYKLTERGYKQAIKYRNPIVFFCKEHWQFITTVSLSFIALLVAICKPLLG